MSRTAVTIEWVLVYAVSSLMIGGLFMSVMGDEAHRPKWVDVAVLLAIVGGLTLIIWQGVQGNLPGTGVSARGFFPFLSRFVAWAGGLGIVGFALIAFAGYLVGRGETNRDFAMGMILLPGMFGGLVGFLAGAVVAIVKAFR